MFQLSRQRLGISTAVIDADRARLRARAASHQKSGLNLLSGVVRMNHALRLGTSTTPGPARLNEALNKAVRLAPHDVLVVIISDFFGADEQTERFTSRLAAHNDVLGLLVHDPMRIDPVGRRINVSDAEQQMLLNLADPKVREAIAGDYREDLLRIAHQLRRLSAPLFLVSNEGDVVDQVRRLLGVPTRGA